MPTRFVDQMDRLGRRFKGLQHQLESALAKLGCDLIVEHSRKSYSGNGGIGSRFRGADDKPRMNRKRFLRFAYIQAPCLWRERILKSNTIVALKIIRGSWNTATLEVGGTCANHTS